MSTSVNETAVPFVNLPLQMSALKDEYLAAFERVLDHGNMILGPEVEEFERRFAEYCGTEYAVGLNSGTDALFLTMLALGIGPGDEVITAPNSFLASASSIALIGAKPVFADIREDLNIDPACVAAAITPQTKAVIPVHLTGRPADLGPILELAEQHNLAVIEDAAQAAGASYRGQRSGGIGTAGCFSFQPLKQLRAIGDGGAVTTNDPDLYDYLIKARNHGLRNRDEVSFWSYNSRLDAIHAAVLAIQLDHLDQWIEQRRELAATYSETLGEYVTVPGEPEEGRSVFHTYMVLADRRDQLQQHLAERGVDAKIHYPVPLHHQDPAQELGYSDEDLPVTSRLAGQILSLPCYPELTQQQREAVSTLR